MNTFMIKINKGIGALAILVFSGSCVDHFLPESLDAFDPESVFTETVYRPQLGRTTLMSNNFNAGNSTLPFTFEILNVKRFDGSDAPELTQYFPVKVWKTPYLGTETSLQEIESKRTTEYRPLFQVRKHSGEFIVWENANSSFVLCSPDSSYTFDVLATNSGGYAYTTRMRLIPTREVAYEPNNVDLRTGLETQEYVHPSLMQGVRSSNEGFLLTPENVKVYFRENEDTEAGAKALTFRFFKEDYTPIDPSKFNLTDWGNLVHGFNIERTAEYVRYTVAYPIPLLNAVSRYTNITGDRARVRFAYNRVGLSGFREESYMELDFSIFKEGNWEIIFVFDGNGPLFTDGVRTDN
ncbi:DUF5007 domain-containing protein [Sphingobacterium sp. FBM7-1]|uniref:DUF5007 domain-containing protein n=1 Tax=Sphingobacterium sp. FBM7-1 TaxID=2886688 RepID=UPI001D10C887|nr:DUF5007 domain-containing protein [Sphingobacterium sp. FBM7-1]MCC2600275.1 DUF5007 domain-containing protein [Sphingobacterium sp. FBM7-1]